MYSQILVEKLGEKVREPFVDIVPYATKCALDIICGNFILLMLFSLKPLKIIIIIIIIIFIYSNWVVTRWQWLFYM